jgi:hypothetical protein
MMTDEHWQAYRDRPETPCICLGPDAEPDCPLHCPRGA